MWATLMSCSRPLPSTTWISSLSAAIGSPSVLVGLACELWREVPPGGRGVAAITDRGEQPRPVGDAEPGGQLARGGAAVALHPAAEQRAGALAVMVAARRRRFSPECLRARVWQPVPGLPVPGGVPPLWWPAAPCAHHAPCLSFGSAARAGSM